MVNIRSSIGGAGTTLTSYHSLIRLMNNGLDVSNCTMDFVIGLVPGQDRKLQSRYISQMKIWLDNMFDGSILIPMNKDYDAKLFVELNNNLVFCPDDPYDIIVQVLVHSKLNAIGRGLVMIERSHIASDQGNGFGTWFDGDPDELLPAQDDWMGEHRYFDQPWWHRPDGSTMDIMALPSDDVSKKPDILVDIDLLDKSRTEDPTDGGKAEIIRPNFKPRIVTDD